MNKTPDQQMVRSILHPTDFSAASTRAFEQALAISLLGDTKLIILHAGLEHKNEVDWSTFPHVRKTLEKWGLLEPDSPRSAVFDKFNLRVGKFSVHSSHPVLATIDYLKNKPVDLIVLGTEGREGLPRINDRSTAESMARWSACMTLFVPSSATRGIVSMENGSGSIKNILVPVETSPDPQSAIDAAYRTAATLGDTPVNITLLHVGEMSQALAIPNDDDNSTWHGLLKQGEVVEQILSTAAEQRADLIVMATAGHDSVLDVLRGSTTEKVLRKSPCPLLAVPQI